MEIIDPAKYCLFAEMTKEFRRSGTDWPDLKEGIYAVRYLAEGRRIVRYDFYDYVITHTEAQQTRREKFADAVAGWQSLTKEQKKFYNKSAIGLNMSGYNLYLSQYIKNEN